MKILRGSLEITFPSTFQFPKRLTSKSSFPRLLSSEGSPTLSHAKNIFTNVHTHTQNQEFSRLQWRFTSLPHGDPWI